MLFSERIKPAFGACLKHLLASALVASLCAALLFGLWYPHPYRELLGGEELLALIVLVDVTCGPLLTFVVFNPRKPRSELYTDIGIIVCLQIAALGYGIGTALQARPVYLAFEGDRFRVVSIPDIDSADLPNAPQNLRDLSYLGPRVIGTRLARQSDPDYVQSIKLSLEGLHPAFRPSRWTDYDLQRAEVARNARPLSKLMQKSPAQRELINEAIQTAQQKEEALGYLPLIAAEQTNWVVVVRLTDSQPLAYLPIDGW